MVLASCTNRTDYATAGAGTKDTTARNFDFILQAEQVEKKQLTALLNNIQDSLSFEVGDLYAPTDSIPDNDFLALDDSLKARGFRVVSGGRGNWDKGPRMISLQLESDHYTCRLDKLYYDDSTKPHSYIVTERAAFLSR